METDRQKVWVVSCYDEGKAPVVTVFDNEQAAMKCYDNLRFFLNYDKHVKVCIDKAPVYQSFTGNGK